MNDNINFNDLDKDDSVIDNDDIKSQEDEKIIERGSPLNNKKRTNNNNGKKKGFLLIVIIAILVVGFAFYRIAFKDKGNPENVNDKPETVSVKTDKQFNAPEQAAAPVLFPNSTPPVINDPEPNDGAFIGVNAPETMLPPTISKSSGGMMISSNGGGSSKSSQSVNDIQYETGDESQSLQELINDKMTGGKGGGQGDMYEASAQTFKPTAAKFSELNPHLSIVQGTIIQCVLRGKLVSVISGQIQCVVTDDVYSKSGSVVLVAKGSIINGYYQGNSTQHGANQIFAVWQEIRTPSNIDIPLFSGSTDELGANGLTGWTETHFWKRFQNAILLSAIMDVNGALASQLSKNGDTDYLQNTRSGTTDLAKTVLDQMGDIKPTLYKNQGDKIGVFVARDIDFSNVYKLKRVSK